MGKTEKYFSKARMEYGTTPMDIIVIGKIKTGNESWLKRLRTKEEYDTLWVMEGIPIAIERPHDLRVGDIMELELTIKRTNKAE